MGGLGTKGSRNDPMFGERFITKLRSLAAEGYESREAWETLVKRGDIPADTKLATFRTLASKAGVQWGNPNLRKQVISILLSPTQIHELSQAAAVRGVTRNLLAQKLLAVIINDRMFNAILDDEPHDPISTDDPQTKKHDTAVRRTHAVPGHVVWPEHSWVRHSGGGVDDSGTGGVQSSE